MQRGPLASRTFPGGIEVVTVWANTQGDFSMDDKSRSDRIRANKETYATRLEAFRRAALPQSSTSPQAVEAALVNISEEVTAEAIERRHHEARLQKLKHTPPTFRGRP